MDLLFWNRSPCNRTEVFLPIIVLTADVNEETKLRALNLGATDFLNKPLDHIEVLLRIRNMLETRRIHQLLENRRAALEDAVAARALRTSRRASRAR